MGYLSGQAASITFASQGWLNNVTRIQSTQTLDETQVKVLGQVNANTVTGAYHTVYTIDIAVADDLAATELQVGASGELVWTYMPAGGTPPPYADTLTVTVVVVDVKLHGAVDGAITGVLTLAGNSALVHAVNVGAP